MATTRLCRKCDSLGLMGDDHERIERLAAYLRDRTLVVT